MPAFEAGRRPRRLPRRPDLPGTPEALLHRLVARGASSPCTRSSWSSGSSRPSTRSGSRRPDGTSATTTTVDITGFTSAARPALQAHETQVDPTSKFWFGLRPRRRPTVFPVEEYVLARSPGPDRVVPEDDLSPACRRPGHPIACRCRRYLESPTRGELADVQVAVAGMARRDHQDGRGPTRTPRGLSPMQYIVSGGPDGEIKYYWVLENGKLLESKLGDLADPGHHPDPDLRRRQEDPAGRARSQRRIHAGPIKVTRQHGQAHGAACRSPTPPEYKELQREIQERHRVLAEGRPVQGPPATSGAHGAYRGGLPVRRRRRRASVRAIQDAGASSEHRDSHGRIACRTQATPLSCSPSDAGGRMPSPRRTAAMPAPCTGWPGGSSGDPAVAEEVVQEVFLRLWNHA